MRGWPWRHDLRRVWSGLGRVARAARAELPDAGIGTFAAESRTAGGSRANRYWITLAHAALEPREVTLVLDVHAVDRAGVALGHVGYAVKRLPLGPPGPARVDICYRWGARATFHVGGVWRSADELWVGEPAAPGFVSVAADLRDADGHGLDRTVIYQVVDDETSERLGSAEPAA